VGIELFLKCANPSVVTDLDLTATVTDHRSALVYKHLYNYATQVPLYALQNNVCFGLPLENNTFVWLGFFYYENVSFQLKIKKNKFKIP